MPRRVCSSLSGVAFCLSIGLGCQSQQRSSIEHQQAVSKEAKAELAVLSRRFGMVFPPSTRILMFDNESHRDEMFRAKLEMSETDFAVFAKQLPLSLEKLRAGRSVLGTDTGGWNPQATPGVKSIQVRPPGELTLNFGMAANSGGLVTVFIMRHGT